MSFHPLNYNMTSFFFKAITLKKKIIKSIKEKK